VKLAIGVDLGGTNIKAGIVNEEGRILDQASIPTGAQEGPDAVIARIVRMVGDLRGKIAGSLLGVGVGSPGPLDPAEGIIYTTPNMPGWENYPMRKKIEEKTRVPVVVENDANCAALAEYWKGAGQGSHTMVLLTLGTGIGGGIVRAGALINGEHIAAGEVGHMVINFDGPKCGCGNHGCLEAYTGAAGIVRRAWEVLEKPGTVSILREMAGGDSASLTPAMISAAAEKGDGVALSMIRETGRLLGVGVTSLVNIFAPETVLLGGGVAAAGEVLFAAVREEVKRRAMPPENERVRILPAAMGNSAGIVGAASLLLRR
jgi:glucokinase